MIGIVERLTVLFVVGAIVGATVPPVVLGAGTAGVPAGTADPGTASVPSSVESAVSSSGRVPSAVHSNEREVTRCTTIDSPGRYVLTRNITEDAPPDEQTTCIVITASDVVFDGAGFEIEGNISSESVPPPSPVEGGVAIRATDASNVTVRNVRLRSWKHGIRLENVTDGDLQFTGYDYAGAAAVGSEDIRLHDSVLRAATVSFEADHAVLRRNTIDADPNGRVYRHAVDIRGSNGVIENNSVDIPQHTEYYEPTGLRVVGDRFRIRSNRLFGDPATRGPETNRDGRAFEIVGNDTTFVNTTVERTLFSSSIEGNNVTFADSSVNISTAPLDIRGDRNTVRNSSFFTRSRVGIFGSENTVTGLLVIESDLSVSGTNSTVSNSELTLEYGSLSVRSNASAFNNTVTDRIYVGSSSVVRNNVAGAITVFGNRSSVYDNRVQANGREPRLVEIGINGGRNNTVRDNGAVPTLSLENGAADNLVRNVTAESVTVTESDDNVVRNVTAGSVTLERSQENALHSFTADEITLRSVSDNNTVAGSSAERIAVVADSRNNTLRNNDASIRIAGRTSFDNRLVGNNASGSEVGIELDRARRTLLLDNRVINNSRGIVLDGASDNRLVNTTAAENEGPSYLSKNASVNNTVTNLTLGPTVSFRSRDVALGTEPSPPAPPAGRSDVGVFLDASNTSADSWLNLTVRYEDADAANVEEGTLRLWSHDGSWSEVAGFNRVDPAANTVTANVSTESFGVLAPLGNSSDGTAPTITNYDARALDGGTLEVAFDSSEPLADSLVVVRNTSGTEVARLNESGLTESGADPYTYTGRVALPNGTYTATLEEAADGLGNDGANGQSDTVTLGETAVRLSLTANRTDVAPGETVGFTVTRADTGEGLNATIVTEDRSVDTGSDGRAALSFPDPGTVDVTATKADTATEAFRNDTVSITVGRSTATSRIGIAPPSEDIVAGESLRVAVTYNATGAAEVYGVQFVLEYDTTLLNATNVTKGPLLGTDADTLVVNSSIDDETGRIGYGESRRTEAGVSGNGTVAYVEFTATEQLGTEETRTDVRFVEVKVSDPDGRRIDTSRHNGSVRVGRNRPPKLSVDLPFTVNNVDSPVDVEVRATDETQVGDVRLVASNGSEVATLRCDDDECDGTLSFTPSTSSWNDSTGAYDPSVYRVVATDAQGVNATATVRTEVHIAGDANGDGVVDIVDAVEVGRGWSCTTGGSCYSDAADLNNDGVVDIFDAVLIGRNWQKTAGS